jgi:hypothetical protein
MSFVSSSPTINIGETNSTTVNITQATTLNLGKNDGSVNFLTTAICGKVKFDPTYGYIQSVIDKGYLGTGSDNLVLTTSDIGSVIRFTTGAARTVLLPALTGVPDGAWIGISCTSANPDSLSTSYAITIRDSVQTSPPLIASYNANNTTISSGGNGKQLVVINGAWVAMAN